MAEEKELSSAACLPPANKKAKYNDKGDDDDDEEEERVFCAAHLLSGEMDESLEHPAQDRGRCVLELFVSSSDAATTTSNDKCQSTWTWDDTREILRGIKKKPLRDDDDDCSLSIHALWHLILQKRNNAGDEMNTNNASSTCTALTLWKMLKEPLQSIAHVLEANQILERALATTTSCSDSENEKTSYQQSHHHLMQALSLWPCNPSALVGLANLVRMGHVSSIPINTTNSNTMQSNQQQRILWALNLYQAAAKAAHSLDQACRGILQSSQPSNDDKFLVETLLSEAAQVDMNDDDSDDEAEDNDETDKGEKEKSVVNDKDRVKQNAPDKGISKVLVTASLMSATLASATGKHDIAAQVLQRFGPNMTRIHPNVWKAAAKIQQHDTIHNPQPQESSCTPTHGAFVPCVFPNTVPDNLFDVLRHAFRPDGPYWQQSGYDRNVYYSFWTDWPLPRPTDGSAADGSTYIVSNAVEHYIVTCLLPRVRAICPKLEETLCGYEWWAHTRPHGSNLGHQLHFDTDEALLEQDKIVEFPISASVTYLNAEEASDETPYGATILFDQTPYVEENAHTAWICSPKSRNFMLFPGDLLHGVLPCTATNGKTVDHSNQGGHDHYRLTFMVNFWSYRIPDRLKKRKLYGPSGPFPPRTKEHSWVEDICQSYPQTVCLPSGAIEPVKDGLVAASPAWENLSQSSDGRKGGSTKTTCPDEHDNSWAAFDCDCILPLPASGGINQRFFVTNAPDFFKGTLFEE